MPCSFISWILKSNPPPNASEYFIDLVCCHLILASLCSQPTSLLHEVAALEEDEVDAGAQRVDAADALVCVAERALELRQLRRQEPITRARRPPADGLQTVAADDCQRHDEAQHEPGRLVADERVGDEQAEGPRAGEDGEAVLPALEERDQRAEAGEDEYRRFLLREPLDVSLDGLAVELAHAGLTPEVERLERVRVEALHVSEERRVEEHPDEREQHGRPRG